MKKIRYFFEYMALAALMGTFRLMSPERASTTAGLIGCVLGPRLAASRKAMANLKMALPGKSAEEYQSIIAGMWDNMARVIAEYPNLEFLASTVEISGLDHLKDALEKNGQVIVFSGHLANWEIMAPCLLKHGIATDLVYRAPNNPWSDKMLDHYRSLNGKLRTLPKSKKGTRRLVEALKEGRSVGILVDQKYNEGLEIPFFGQPAMTSPAFVQLAQKYDCGLVPFRVMRVEGTRFRLSFFPAMRIFDEQTAPLPVEDVMMNAHELLESWITERPEEWLWLHRRWVNRSNSQPRPADHLQPAA